MVCVYIKLAIVWVIWMIGELQIQETDPSIDRPIKHYRFKFETLIDGMKIETHVYGMCTKCEGWDKLAKKFLWPWIERAKKNFRVVNFIPKFDASATTKLLEPSLASFIRN